jgi:hypothetical protein
MMPAIAANMGELPADLEHEAEWARRRLDEIASRRSRGGRLDRSQVYR